jgi:hypothetical protein
VLALSLSAALITPALSALVASSPQPSALVLDLNRVPLFERVERAHVSSSPKANDLKSGSALPYSFAEFALIVYLLGAATVLGRTLGSQWKARKLARQGQPFLHGVVLSEAVDVPAVVGITSPTILLPLAAQAWSTQRMNTVLLHERAHIQQRDGLALLVARLACALYWPLPLVWIVARCLRRECELAADERVVRAGVAASTYANELIAVARTALRPTPAAAFGMASELENRVRALLTTPALPWTRLRFSLTWLLSLTVTVLTCSIRDNPSIAKAEATARTDPRLQAIVKEEAERARSDWSAESVVAVVMDPRTGSVLASFGDVDRPVVPGSTMKPFAVAAALEAKAIQADGSFHCETSPRRYGKRTLQDGTAVERVDLGGLLAMSSNVCTSRVYDKLGGARLLEALQRLHFGERPGALPASLADGSFEGALVATGVGVSASPLQLAAGYASLATGEYRSPSSAGDRSAPERVMSEQTAHTLRDLLAQVVYSATGTGRAAAVPGVRVIGKTGTSELAHVASDATYASFAGLAPAAAPELAVYVGITRPRGAATGGKAAAPVFARIVRRALGR